MKTIINTPTTSEKGQAFFLSYKNSKRIQWSSYRRYSL